MNGQCLGRTCDSEEATRLRKEIASALDAQDYLELRQLAIKLLRSTLCRRIVRRWFNRLPVALRGPTFDTLVMVIEENAAVLATSELSLEIEMRWMYFITAFCAEDDRVYTALGLGHAPVEDDE